VVIKVLFIVLILSTAALVGVGLAIHFRVQRHLRESKVDAPLSSPDAPASPVEEETGPLS
jgi:hypothetical protein